MEFTDKRIDNGLVMIAATGEIQMGDTDRLMSVLVTLPAKENHALALNSPGGNIVASQSQAETIARGSERSKGRMLPASLRRRLRSLSTG